MIVNQIKKLNSSDVSVPKKGYKIAYLSDRDVNRKVLVIGTSDPIEPEDFNILLQDTPSTRPIFSPEGDKIAMGYISGAIRVFEYEQETPVFCLKGHDAKIESLVFSSDGSKLLSSGVDSKVILWNLLTNTMIFSFISDTPHKLLFSLDSSLFFVCSHKGRVSVHDAKNGDIVLDFEKSGKFTDISVSPDGNTVSLFNCIFPDEKFVLFSLRSLEFFGNINFSSNRPGPLVFSPCKKTVFYASSLDHEEHIVAVMTLETRRIEAKLTGNSKKIKCIEISPDGKILATASNSEVILWSTVDWKKLAKIDTLAVSKVQFSADSTRLVVSSYTDSIVWGIMPLEKSSEEIIPIQTGGLSADEETPKETERHKKKKRNKLLKVKARYIKIKKNGTVYIKLN